MVENIAHRELTDDLKDLCQMVYLILLEYDASKLQDLWEHDEMSFFLARVILNQLRSVNSPYYYIYRRMQERSVYMGVGADINEVALEHINRAFIPKMDKK